jgi:hypothetical protein
LKPFAERVLAVFRRLDRDRLDLHALIEECGYEPTHSVHVLAAIESLIREGLLEASGGDFYALTKKGKLAINYQDGE